MTTPNRGAQRQAVLTATITVSGDAKVSSAVALGENMVLCGMYLPSAWTSSAVSFQVSNGGVTFGDLYDLNGQVLTGTLAASAHVSLDPATFCSWSYIKIKSTSDQAADRIISVLVRSFA